MENHKSIHINEKQLALFKSKGGGAGGGLGWNTFVMKIIFCGQMCLYIIRFL